MGVALPHAGIAIDAEDIAEEKVSTSGGLFKILSKITKLVFVVVVVVVVGGLVVVVKVIVVGVEVVVVIIVILVVEVVDSRAALYSQ